LAGSSEPRATARKAPIFSRRMSSISSTSRLSPVPFTAARTLSTNTEGVKVLAGALTHSRMRFVASARAVASLTAAAARFAPSRPMMLSASMAVTASSCRVFSDPMSKLPSAIPSVAARARSAASVLPATSFGRTTASRVCPRLRRLRAAACSALRRRTMSNLSFLPTPTRIVHLLGALPRLLMNASSMIRPRNSRSLSTCAIAPFSFLSRVCASLGTPVCPS